MRLSVFTHDSGDRSIKMFRLNVSGMVVPLLVLVRRIKNLWILLKAEAEQKIEDCLILWLKPNYGTVIRSKDVR